MSYRDHPPSRPLPCMPPPSPSVNLGGLWSQSHMNNTMFHSQTRFEHAPPFKRPRNYDNNATNYQVNNATNSVPFQPLNQGASQPNPTGIRGTGNIFFKTRMCAKFLAGTCSNGESCTFAHGVEDMREPPPNWKEIIRDKDRETGNWNDDQRIIHREKICRRFYSGEECPYGNNCSFLHESPSRFKSDIARAPPRESTAISIGRVGPVMEQSIGRAGPVIEQSIGRAGPVMEQKFNTGQAVLSKHFDANTDAFQLNVKPWKTKICSKWGLTGQCPFGERCHFAHGDSELQVPGSHMEAEIMTNAHSFQTKALPQLVTADALPTKAEAILPTQERVNPEVLPKWKAHKKINTIYGDWPEDLIPPENLRR